MLDMKKYIALFLTLGFFAFLPSAVADERTLAVDAPAHIRLPHNHNNNHTILTTLQVKNIQVEAGWQVHSDSSLSLQISNGVLSINEPLTVTQIVATVIVQDLFTKLNQAYENLSVQAVITIEIGHIFLADAHIRIPDNRSGYLHTFAATGEPTAYNIVAGNQTYFTLGNTDGVLSVLGGLAIGFYTLTVEVSNNAGNTAQAVAIVQIHPALSLSDAPRLNIPVSENAVSLHTFTASGGFGDKTYTFVPVQSSYFSLGATSGVLSADANAPAGVYILTVQAADEDNNTIQVLATAEIYLPLSLPGPSILYAARGPGNTSLHTFAAVGGLGAKTYAIVSGNDAGYFTINNGGAFTAQTQNAVAGEYTLVIEVSDSIANKATVTVTIQLI